MYMHQTVAVACIVVGALAAAVAGAIQPEEHEPIRAVKEYNLPKKSTLAIKGYDPVAYFPEGGRKATRGKADIELTYKGVTYRFASEANRDRFRAKPAKYEPAYGGWCAWAMADGKKASIDPKKFVVKDDRLFLYFNGLANDTRAKWLKRDHEAQADAADRAWKKLTREEPRKPSQIDDAPPPGA